MSRFYGQDSRTRQCISLKLTALIVKLEIADIMELTEKYNQK